MVHFSASYNQYYIMLANQRDIADRCHIMLRSTYRSLNRCHHLLTPYQISLGSKAKEITIFLGSTADKRALLHRPQNAPQPQNPNANKTLPPDGSVR